MKPALAFLAGAIVLASCGNTTEPDATATPQAIQRRAPCPAELPFVASDVPKSVTDDLREGPGGPDATPDPQAVEFHYAGEGDARIDIRRGAAYYPGENPTLIRVLGEPAQLSEIDDGYSVNFQSGAGRCGRYEITAYGIDRDEVVRFVEGLRER